MPSSVGRDILALGVTFAAGTVLIFGLLKKPEPVDYADWQPPDLSGCGYENAKNSADAAADRYANPSKKLSAAESARALHEAEAAAQKREDARVCEERQRADADLAAQWHAATAAENAATMAAAAYYWGLAELVLLIIAIGAAGWAALEANRAAKAAEKSLGVAEKSLKKVEGPLPYPETFGFAAERYLKDGVPHVRVRARVALTNFGRSPCQVMRIGVTAKHGEPTNFKLMGVRPLKERFLLAPLGQLRDRMEPQVLEGEEAQPSYTEDAFTRIADKHVPMVMNLRIIWSDAFGGYWEVTHRYRFNGGSINDRQTYLGAKPIMELTGEQAEKESL